MPEPMNLMRKIGYCGHLGRQYLDLRLRRLGYDVTPVQSHALMYLNCSENNGSAPQRELERELRLTAPTINGIVSRLAEKGYLLRQTSPDDGRCRILVLTDAGREIIAKFHSALQGMDDAVYNALSPEEQLQLHSLLQRVISKLESEVKSK